MKIIERLKSRMNKIDRNKSIVFSFPILFFILITFIVVLADPVPTRSVEITSNYSGQGSWTINKSAEWISANKARITLELNSQMKTLGRNKDIILVMDVSGSMAGDKLSKAKEDAKDLVSTLLTDSNNRIALITFESTSSKLSDLTNDSTTINSLIDSLTANGSTNYNSGLVEAKNIIDNYTQVNNKDLVVLFLTDGYPNEEVPNQVSTYQIIKEQYPYVIINAIQYEMGTDIIQDIIDISDYQYIASMETLNNVLFESSLMPIEYSNFKVEDYISEFFEIESIASIKPTIGVTQLSIENGLQKVTWNLRSIYRTGQTQSLTIDVLLKEQYKSIDSLFETNDHEVITSKLPSDSERIVNSELTPILAGKYTVIYDTNTPTGCTLSNIPSERYFPFETINIRTQELTCNNYIFRGYDIEDKDIKIINTTSFIMPGRDVTIRALWTKVDISQRMNGEVATALDFYKIVKNEYKSNSGYAGKYTGQHKDSFNREATKEIYYYTAPTTSANDGNTLLDKFNVIFAGYCWQMLRTTDTGGVKMIYNGTPVDGKCLNTRGNENGVKQASRITDSMNGTYAYGTDFTYDLDNGTFKIDGTIKENINYSNDKSVIGYYTCKDADKDATCSTLYYLEDESDVNDSPFMYPYTIINTNYTQIGESVFNQVNSPAYTGYMYNKAYSSDKYTNFMSNYNYIRDTYNDGYTPYTNVLSYNTISTSYWYADSVSYDPDLNEYSLNNPYQISSSSDYPSLKGKYTFKNSEETYKSSVVYYIGGVSGSGCYTVYLSDGKTSSSVIVGNSYIDNGDNTYSLQEVSEIPVDSWFDNYENYRFKYYCEGRITCSYIRFITRTLNNLFYSFSNFDRSFLIAKSRNGLELTDTLIVNKIDLSKNSSYYSDYKYTCGDLTSICTEDNLKYITEYSDWEFEFIKNIGYFGENVTWNGIKYTINNIVGFEVLNDINSLATHRYACLNPLETECSKVVYIYYYKSNDSDRASNELYYIILENGSASIDSAINDMLYANNVNTKDSDIKRFLDEWYYNSLLGYDSYLEETIYCNDRSISKTNDISSFRFLEFKNYNTNNNLMCLNETDQFSVSNNKAKLKYKIGLASSSEMFLINNNTARKTSKSYWTSSPHLFSSNYSYEKYILTSGSISNNSVSGTAGVRPVISLASGVVPASGTGTMNDPYVVDETVIPGN